VGIAAPDVDTRPTGFTFPSFSGTTQNEQASRQPRWVKPIEWG
jgi:hypothetical protein